MMIQLAIVVFATLAGIILSVVATLLGIRATSFLTYQYENWRGNRYRQVEYHPKKLSKHRIIDYIQKRCVYGVTNALKHKKDNKSDKAFNEQSHKNSIVGG